MASSLVSSPQNFRLHLSKEGGDEVLVMEGVVTDEDGVEGEREVLADIFDFWFTFQLFSYSVIFSLVTKLKMVSFLSSVKMFFSMETDRHRGELAPLQVLASKNQPVWMCSDDEEQQSRKGMYWGHVSRHSPKELVGLPLQQLYDDDCVMIVWWLCDECMTGSPSSSLLSYP